ncbi:homoserine kinase [Corynebacterium heidelbergense]|uniref:Homoserine kinase n=1 Tax=Corynebacterium heidelbergense TaxID=2055947 RepID=A0A364V3X9_9CORY|nr:homoserine kinase [Corynebacterium heidelbergense]RAV31328.1 homoserine kinase [Corynebacterium heidelbergense]
MSTEVPVGTRVHVKVPGSSANLGPGFDTLGLALSVYDHVDVEVVGSGLEVEVTGEGAGEVPLDERHLVVRALRAGLAKADVSVRGLKVHCHNSIPQSRGMGSSASAAVAGIAAANGLVGNVFTPATMIQLAASFEGHPDNAAASILGGAVVSWTNTPVDGRTAPQYYASRMEVHPDIEVTALIPNFHASTQAVRSVLPTDVSHVDARFNVSRTAVMTIALRSDPSLLWEGTRDRLHQPYRAEALPVTAEWVNRLRNQGYPAFLSGAGPTVLVLSTEDVDLKILEEAADQGLRVERLRVADGVEVTAGQR